MIWFVILAVVLYVVIGAFIAFAYGMSDNFNANSTSIWTFVFWPILLLFRGQ